MFGQGFGQDLDRHLAVEGGVGGRPDDPHAALAELFTDAVVEKSRILI